MKILNWILGFIIAAIGFVSIWLVAKSVKKESRQLAKNDPDAPKNPNITQDTQGVFWGATRGMRNNNPGNIEANGIVWQGMTGSDGRFVIFKDMEHGLRALLRILKTYNTKHGLDTIEEIIGRFAPKPENDTEAYIKFVCDKTGIPRNQKIDFNTQDSFCRLAQAMCQKENSVVLPMTFFYSAYTIA